MSQISAHLTTDLALQSMRGADMFSAFLAGMEANKRRREERRQAGVDSVAELATCLLEARATEARAVSVAQALADENAALRAQLAAARRAVVVERGRTAEANAVIHRTAAAVRAAAWSHA